MATLDFWGILNLINTEFPQYVPLLTKPGVFDVFTRYATAKSSGVNPWTRDQLLAEYHKTPYYQTSTDASRQNDLLRATDPATWNQKVEQTKRVIDDLEKELGVNLDKNGGLSSPAFSFLVNAARNGWDANEIRYRMIQGVNQTNSGGLIASNAAHVKNMANDYGIPLSDKATMDWATKLTQGGVDDQGIQGYLIEQAKSMFPSIGDALDRGFTVRQIADPYLQLAQQELEVDPSTINLTDGKWLAALNQVDPKTGQRTSMSLDSWLAKIRSDPSYGYDTTSKARNDATNLMDNLGKMFGSAA